MRNLDYGLRVIARSGEAAFIGDEIEYQEAIDYVASHTAYIWRRNSPEKHQNPEKSTLLPKGAGVANQKPARK
ncbi:MAG: hypothetical protein RLZ71_1053 [Actinomycetota bacterium]|jgi:hypothetical protein